ncbi:hypothetical protein [Thalassomonas sp. RHCl1]|uniref:hypothetical protein n=1 Tax=Thalassomonas sp. RHCl1 TaxID=2995320 RepID=UPI00248ADF91|nr:hypothetical protein [Thalassomonas sp. RHCl1]
MDIQHVEHQIHFFTDNENIRPEPSTISMILKELGSMNLIPTTAKALNKATGQQVNILRMITSDEQFQVTFAPEAIVISLKTRNKAVSFESIVTQVTKLFELLKLIYPDKKSNRISSVTTIFSQTNEEQEDNKIRDMYLKNENETPFEWTIRKCFSVNLGVSNEKINSVHMADRAKFMLINDQHVNNFDGYRFTADSNTISENTSYRFDLSNSIDLIKELNNDNLEVLKPIIDMIN